MQQDKIAEIRHNKEIEKDAEFFWGWSSPAGKLRARRRAEMIISEVKKRGLLKILEVGSGTGIFTEYFCKAGLEVSGIDISQELLVNAKNKCRGVKTPFLSAADIEKLPFRDGSFDAVVGVCVLHHVEPLGALQEIKRVVRKGGVIIFSEPNMMNPQLLLQKNIKPIKRISILGETEDETAFFRWQIKNILKGLDFKAINVAPFDFLHPWTPKPLINVVKNLGVYFEKTPVLREIAGSLFIYADK